MGLNAVARCHDVRLLLSTGVVPKAIMMLPAFITASLVLASTAPALAQKEIPIAVAVVLHAAAGK